MEHTMDTILAMRRQEETFYCVVDYLSQFPPPSNFSTKDNMPVDYSCRKMMGSWFYDICNFCHYKRETAAIAMSILDRFMATSLGYKILLDRNLYQLSAMTALYTSVKIHEQEAMDPKLVSSLSRGVHTPQAVEEMEAKMLQAIQFHVNPPTSMSFVRSMLDLVPTCTVSEAEKETITEITEFQVELAVNEYNFVTCKASSIAFASLLNSMESLVEDDTFLATFANSMAVAANIDPTEIRDLRISLYEVMNGNDTTFVPQQQQLSSSETTHMDTSCGETIHDYNSSPRSVSA